MYEHYWIEVYGLEGEMARRVYPNPISVERRPRRAKTVLRTIREHPKIDQYLQVNNGYSARLYNNKHGRTPLREIDFEVVPHKGGVRYNLL